MICPPIVNRYPCGAKTMKSDEFFAFHGGNMLIIQIKCGKM